MGKKCCGLACSHGLILIIFGMAHIIIILNYFLLSHESRLPDTTFYYRAKWGEGQKDRGGDEEILHYNPTGIQ
jgi:hypothetical protein